MTWNSPIGWPSRVNRLSNGTCERLGIPSREVGRPTKGGLNALPACDSADVRDPFLSLNFGCGSRLCWKLQHRRFLPFKHVRQEHDLPIWKFQRIMVGSRVVLIDLPEDRRRMGDHIRLPAKQHTWAAHYQLGKGELRSRKNAHRRVGIFRRSEPASTGIEVVGGQLVANLSRTRLYIVQAVVAHG